MNGRRLIIIGASCILLCLGVFLIFQPETDVLSESQDDGKGVSVSETDSMVNPATRKPGTTPKAVNVPDPNDPRLNRLPDGTVEYKLATETSAQINRSSDPLDTIDVFKSLFQHYRFAYKENPVGSENAEITKQLLGENPMQIIFVAPDHPSVVENELVDVWGTPFFFHALSGQEMEVRSAGPDQQMWTSDDVFTDG